MNLITIKITGEDTVLAYNLLSKSNNYLVFITDGENGGYDCKNTQFELFGGDLYIKFNWVGLWESEDFVGFSVKNCKLRVTFTALRPRQGLQLVKYDFAELEGRFRAYANMEIGTVRRYELNNNNFPYEYIRRIAEEDGTNNENQQ